MLHFYPVGEGVLRVFACGDQVVYGIHGVCRVCGIETRTVDRKKVEYLLLEPLEQPGASYYIPAQNPAALAKLYPLLTKQQMNALLQTVEALKDPWIEDESRRKQCYRELIGSGDRAALLGMICSLNRRRDMQQKAGKRLHQCDENFLRDAQKRLCAEIALVMDIPLSEAEEQVRQLGLTPDSTEE